MEMVRSLDLERACYPTLPLDPAQQEITGHVTAEQGAVARSVEGTVDEPLLESSLDAKACCLMSSEILPRVSHGQLSPGERAAEPGRIEVKPERRIEPPTG